MPVDTSTTGKKKRTPYQFLKSSKQPSHVAVHTSMKGTHYNDPRGPPCMANVTFHKLMAYKCRRKVTEKESNIGYLPPSLTGIHSSHTVVPWHPRSCRAPLVVAVQGVWTCGLLKDSFLICCGGFIIRSEWDVKGVTKESFTWLLVRGLAELSSSSSEELPSSARVPGTVMHAERCVSTINTGGNVYAAE